MTDVLSVFIVLAGIIIIGYIGELIFKKTKIPDVIFLILVGIVLNIGTGLVKADSLGFGATIFSTFTLVYLLFQGAINLDFRTILGSLKGALTLSFVSFIITVVVTSGISLVVLKLPLMLSILLGTMVGGISSTVVIPIVNNLDITKNNKSILTLESAISDVFCIVGAITIMSIMTTGTVTSSSVIKQILSSFSVAIIIGLIVGMMWMFLMSKHKDLAGSEMVTIAVIMLLYAFIESSYVNASGAIGVLIFGLILGNSKSILSLKKEKAKKIKNEDKLLKEVITNSSKNFYQQISFFVKVFFFVYLGILIDISDPIVFLWGLLITVALFLVRPLVVKLSLWNVKNTTLDRTTLEVLIPKGLAAAVIAQTAIQKGIKGADLLTTPVLSIIVTSILLTSILVFLTSKGKFNGFGYLFRTPKNDLKK